MNWVQDAQDRTLKVLITGLARCGPILPLFQYVGYPCLAVKAVHNKLNNFFREFLYLTKQYLACI